MICCCTVSMFTVTFTTHFRHCCFLWEQNLTCPLLYLSSLSVRSIVSHCKTGHSPGIPKKHSGKTTGSNMLISGQSPETMSCMAGKVYDEVFHPIWGIGETIMIIWKQWHLSWWLTNVMWVLMKQGRHCISWTLSSVVSRSLSMVLEQ